MKFSGTHIIDHLIKKKVTIAPLVTFRILFGMLMLISTIRFWANGWIFTQYIEPKFYFPFIEGLAPFPEDGMYIIFFLIGLTSFFISLGLFYRVSTVIFFLLFTYVELLDKTNYLNHYYFISIISFLLIWMPAHRHFSLDLLRKSVKPLEVVPVFFLNIIKVQLGIVYFFAGIAKINTDWLLHAQPLKLWLSTQVYQPVIGEIFRYEITAYVFSWFGMLFDTCIPFFLAIKKTMPYAYLVVVIFHLMTGLLFPIGVFPLVMILATTIFFPPEKHKKFLDTFTKFFNYSERPMATGVYSISRVFIFSIAIFFSFQLLFPLRYLVSPGNLFWNEAGYRFSWRVMLMEKAGNISFLIEDKTKKYLVANYEYLTPQQEKMMSTQPDMILQFVRFLEKEFTNKGFSNPKITAQSSVTLNGRPGRPFVDPEVDLTSVSSKSINKFILPYE